MLLFTMAKKRLCLLALSFGIQLRPWLEKLRAKILRQLSESSLVLFQSSGKFSTHAKGSIVAILPPCLDSLFLSPFAPIHATLAPENDPSELRKSVDGLLHTIKTEIAQQKDTSVRQIYGSKRESRPSLSGENLDTSFIDSKAQEICSKYKAISQNISSLLAATEDRIRVFENSLAAAARQANEPAPASSASVASAASSSARSRSAAHSLQDHLNASY